MVKRRLNVVFATMLILVSLILVVILSSTRFRQIGLQTLAEQRVVATSQQIYLPAVQQGDSKHDTRQAQEKLAVAPTATPTIDGISLPPDWRDKEPENKPTETPGPLETEPFNTPIPYTPVPTPDVNVKTNPALDRIMFVNFRELRLPSAFPSFYGQVAWSPDGKEFVGLYDGTMDGKGLNAYQLYKGNVETGEFSLWVENGNWPVWSRDGQYVYYLAPRQDGTRFFVAENLSRPYYDLFRKSVNNDGEELMLKDIEPPGVPVPQLSEIATGEILKLDTSQNLILLPSAAELVKVAADGAQPTTVASFEEVTGKLEGIGSVYSHLPPSFALSRGGKLAIAVAPGKATSVLDLNAFSVIGTIDAIDTAANITWAPDDSAFVYINGQGLFLYNIASQQISELISIKALGLNPEDLRSSMGAPFWALDGQVLFFIARSTDWVQEGTESHAETFVFVISVKEKIWRPIGWYGLESISPDGHHAIIRKPDAATGAVTSGAVTLWLVDIQQ